MIFQCFRCDFDWNLVKYTKITIIHVLCIVLTLARSLDRCLNTWPSGLFFKWLPQDLANATA